MKGAGLRWRERSVMRGGRVGKSVGGGGEVLRMESPVELWNWRQRNRFCPPLEKIICQNCLFFTNILRISTPRGAKKRHGKKWICLRFEKS